MIPLIKVVNLAKTFILKRGEHCVFSNVSFEIHEGETLGLVGESGSGKTTLAHCLMRFEKPTLGEILVKGKNLETFDAREAFAFRRMAQMIFQHAYASLNPKMTIESILKEPF